MATCCGLVLTVNDLEFGEYSYVQNLFLSDGAGRSESVISIWSILSQKYAFCLGMQQGVIVSTFRIFLLHLVQDSLWPCTNEMS